MICSSFINIERARNDSVCKLYKLDVKYFFGKFNFRFAIIKSGLNY